MPKLGRQLRDSNGHCLPTHHRFHMDRKSGLFEHLAHLREPDPVGVETGSHHEFGLPPTGWDPHIVKSSAEMIAQVDLMTGDAVGLQNPAHLRCHLLKLMATHMLEDGLRKYQVDTGCRNIPI